MHNWHEEVAEEIMKLLGDNYLLETATDDELEELEEEIATIVYNGVNRNSL